MEAQRPPIIERINDPEKLLAQIVECLECQDCRGLKTYVLEHKLKEDSILWEVVLKIGEKVTSKTSQDNEEFFNVCNRCLLYLMKVGKPKEMLLALLEQLEQQGTCVDDIKYICFLPLIQLVLLKIPTKLFHSLDATLETVSVHLQSLSQPENIALEGEERRLFHVDEKVLRIVNIVEQYLDFLEPFVELVTNDQKVIAPKHKDEALVLKKHLVRIFDFPFLELILTHDPDKPITNSRACVEKAMKMLCVLETDFHRFLVNARIQKRVEKEDTEMIDDDDEGKSEEVGNKAVNKEKCLASEEKDNAENEARQQKGFFNEKDIVKGLDFKLVSQGAQACLTYVILSEFLGLDKFPQTFTRQYLLEFHLETVSYLLKKTVYPINEKGLLLCKSLVDSIQPGTLPSHCLDNPGYMTIVQDLIHIMTKCPVKDHRSAALPLFTSMIRLFDDGGRYLIFDNIFSSCSHSGVKGYTITLLKEEINRTLQVLKGQTKSTNNATTTDDNSSTSVRYFSGSKLSRILGLATCLSDRETSDMLENSDQIISAFNLLRFIVLADPHAQNLTGFWGFLAKLEKDFLAPLRKGLDLSEAHYNLERQNVMAGTESSSLSGSGSMEMDVNVEGSKLPVMERTEKLALISKALNTHQLMKSLLSRLSELIDRSKSGQSA